MYLYPTLTINLVETEGSSVTPDLLLCLNLLNFVHHLLAIHWLVRKQAADLS